MAARNAGPTQNVCTFASLNSNAACSANPHLRHDSDPGQSVGSLLENRAVRSVAAARDKAAELQRRVSGPDHPSTCEKMHNVATTYDPLHQDEQAQSLYIETIDGKKRILGESHPSTVLTVLRFAQMRQRQRRYADAEMQLIAAARTLGQTSDADRQSAESVLTQLVSLYTEWGKPDQAAEWSAKLPKKSATKTAAR